MRTLVGLTMLAVVSVPVQTGASLPTVLAALTVMTTAVVAYVLRGRI